MKILDYNHCKSNKCRHYPNCGWNIQLGGTSEKELQDLKKALWYLDRKIKNLEK